jgi:hypothetical protein
VLQALQTPGGQGRGHRDVLQTSSVDRLDDLPLSDSAVHTEHLLERTQVSLQAIVGLFTGVSRSFLLVLSANARYINSLFLKKQSLELRELRGMVALLGM